MRRRLAVRHRSHARTERSGGRPIALVDVCGRVQEALSASIDNEDPGIAARAIDAHLRICAECRSYAQRAEDLRRHTRVQVAPPVPDLTNRILDRLAPSFAAPRALGLRVTLAVIAATQLLNAAQTLLLGVPNRSAVHTGRDAWVFGVALSGAFLIGALHPSRLLGLNAVVVVLAVWVGATMVFDLAAGRIGLIDEAHHTSALIGLMALFMLQPCRPSSSDRFGVA